MPEVTIDGQRRLKAARVLCIGAGGLGSPAALYLAAAGVGTIGLVDFDDVDLTNLQRQILHGTKDVGRKKLESARDRLRDVNPNIDLELHDCRFTSANAQDLIERYDIVVDGSDNFPTRYLSNDVCVWARKPNVYGSVFRFDGQSTVFAPHLGGPCYRCMFPEPPPAGNGPQLRGSRRARRASRNHRNDSGDGSNQTHPRPGRIADRTAPAFRRAENEIPRIQFAARSAMSGLRRESDDHFTDRLRTILRHEYGDSRIGPAPPRFRFMSSSKRSMRKLRW